MKKILYFVPVLLIVIIGVTTVLFDKEVHISLDKVPEKVFTSALEAVPGIIITEAEVLVETTFENLVYELDGEVNGKKYEIQLSPQGRVLKIEQ